MTSDAYRFLGTCIRGTALGVSDWEGVFDEAAAETVLPSLSGLLRGCELPAEVASFLSAVTAANSERNALISRELRAAVELLNSIGIVPVLLKGVAYQAIGLYPEAGSRYLQDIDLLLPVEDLAAGAAVMRAHGFVAGVPDAFGEFRHHLRPLHRANRVWVELHARLGPAKCAKMLPAREVIAGSREAELDGVRVRIPCPEHLMVHLVMHSQMQHPYNQRVWPQMRAMFDLVLLGRKYGALQTTDFENAPSESRMATRRADARRQGRSPGPTNGQTAMCHEALDWDRVAERFRRNGAYDLLALHLMQVRESTGVEVPLRLEVGWVARIRWARRQFLRRWPGMRYVDPIYMYSTVFGHRVAMARSLLGSRKGLRYLAGQVLVPDNYARIWTDLVEGRGR